MRLFKYRVGCFRPWIWEQPGIVDQLAEAIQTAFKNTSQREGCLIRFERLIVGDADGDVIMFANGREQVG